MPSTKVKSSLPSCKKEFIDNNEAPEYILSGDVSGLGNNDDADSISFEFPGNDEEEEVTGTVFPNAALGNTGRIFSTTANESLFGDNNEFVEVAGPKRCQWFNYSSSNYP